MRPAVLLCLIVVALVVALMVSGCEGGDPLEGHPNLSYFRDYRTEQCFAATKSNTYYGWEVVSIAAVPCESIPTEILR